MPRDTTRLSTSSIGFRVRRAHAKSRNGCLRCKQQRKKCDERRPSCSRCANRSYDCCYQGPPADASSSDEHEVPDRSYSDLDIPLPSPQVSVFTLEDPSGPADNYLSVPGSVLNASCHLSPLGYSPSPRSADERAVPRQLPDTLNAMELGLLGHYLTHTSHSIPCDKLDLYALSVGMPNLAFTSKPVMSSLIALAAACKSHDLVTGTRTPLDGPVLAQVRDLLRLAEHHHRASLQHIQAYISQSDWYDTILANAALMVLYASANHSTRVHLAITAKRASRQLPSDVLPQNSQWISFTRAAHIASSAVLRDIVDAADYFPTPMSSSTSSAQGLPLDAWNDSRVLSPELGPSERTKSLFLPLVASTYVRAHETLRKRADSIAARFKEAESLQDHLDVGACLEALPLLEACATATLSRTEPQDTPENEKPESVVFDDSCKVSSWVGKYMISVTSMTLPTVLRRTIMSYLNKAPSDFLNIIQSVLDLPAAEGTVDHLSPRYENMALLTPTQLLAVDIFAHWLVLLLLLDGVWWIGRIGQWELGQVVSLIKNQDLLPQLADPDSDETWWPQSMYFVNLELLAGV